LVPKGKTIADLEIPQVANYCGLDAYATWHLVPKLRADLEAAPELLNLLLEVEQPLEPVLAQMETWGIRIDQDYLKAFSQRLEVDLRSLEERAYAAAGETFNLGSPKQLSDLLFNKLQLNPKKSRKTKLGYSTDAQVLENMQGDHPVIDLILEYRTLAKLKSTYVDALPNLVRADTQRVHTDFNQAITTTGRLSSSNPNLQNIPIRTEFSRQIRAAFIPEPDWILVTADYSQIELRILAHLSQEPRLVEAYQNNQDVHKLTAQLLLEKEDITSEERRLAKIINFGVIYGMGAQRFSREAGVSYADAKVFIERFYERYPGVFAYLQRMEQQAIAQGYVETILGRRRYFSFDSRDLIPFRGKDLVALAEVDLSAIKISNYDRGLLRAAANAPIQGSSADMIKVAMVKLQEQLKPYRTRLLIQVHDELVLEMPPEEWEEVRSLIQSTMATAIPLSIPLIADIHSGPNWMAAK
jgi:DNA polymerase I